MFRSVMRISNDFAELERASRETARLLEAQGVAPELVRTINLGLEEVVTNILKYGYDDDQKHQIEITFLLTVSDFQMVVTDDGHEFNPLEQPEPDRDKPLDDLVPGGLGIYFLRKLFDDLEYRREARHNSLILRKRWAEPRPEESH